MFGLCTKFDQGWIKLFRLLCRAVKWNKHNYDTGSDRNGALILIVKGHNQGYGIGNERNGALEHKIGSKGL